MPTLSTLHDSNIHPIAIGKMIETLDLDEAPLLKRFGYSNANLKKLGTVRDWPSTELKWINDIVAPKSSTTTTTGTGTTIAVAATHGVRFRDGDLCVIERTKEIVLVTSVATDNLTVERGYGATSPVALVSGDVVRIVSRAMPEGNDALTGYHTSTTTMVNYAQIISQAVEVTETERAVSHIGIQDQLRYQTAKLFNDGGTAGELPRALANIFYYGEPIKRDSSNRGSAGGFKTYVTSNVTDLAQASLDTSHINKILRQVRDAGGRITHVIGNSKLMEVLDDLYPAKHRDPASGVGGAEPLGKIRTTHGSFVPVYDYMAPDNELYFVNEAYVGWLPLREFSITPIGRTGDKYTQDIVGEYTFFARHDKTHGYISNINTGL